MAIILPIATKFNDSGLKKAQAGMGNLSGSIKKMVGLAAGGLAVAGVIRGIGAWVKAAAEDAKGQKILAGQLQRTTGATKDQIAQTEDWIKAQSLATGILDDQLRPSLANAVRGTGSLADGQKLLQVALDGAAASGKPVDTVLNALIKAQNGNTTSLYKLAPELKKTKGNIDDYATSVKNAAKESASPFDKFKVAVSEMKESIGGALLPVISKLAEAFIPIIDVVGPMLGKALEALMPLFDAIVQVLPTLMTAMQPILDIIKLLAGAFGEVLGTLVEALVPILSEMADIFGQVLAPILPVVMDLFNQLVPVLIPFIDALLQIFAALVPIIPSIMTLVTAFMPLVTAILPPLTTLLLSLIPIVTIFAQVFIAVLKPVIDVVALLVHWVADVFGGAIKWIADVIKVIGPIIGGVFQTMGDVIGGAVSIAVTILKGMINFIIDLINALIGGLNMMADGVRFITFGAVDVHINPIPKLAKGGVVMPSPGGSLVNVAEAGQPEAIIPLDQMGSVMGGGGGGGAMYNITINAGAGANGKAIGADLVNYIKQFERSNGAGWRS